MAHYLLGDGTYCPHLEDIPYVNMEQKIRVISYVFKLANYGIKMMLGKLTATLHLFLYKLRKSRALRSLVIVVIDHDPVPDLCFWMLLSSVYKLVWCCDWKGTITGYAGTVS